MSTSNDPAEGHEHKEIDTHLAEVITPETTRAGVRPVRIAFEGCGHGMLDDIYTAIKAKSEHRGWSDGVDLVIIGGDFQAVRNPADLTCLSVPERYRALGDFPAYYAGEKKAPYLTMFVGGNHEASNYMQELYYGGWVAPNIYYLGAANVVRFAGLRIAGLSGIFAAYDYAKHHFERLPYNNNDQKSVYHTRQIDVRKLMQLQNQVDIVVSHDWPQGIEHFGDSAKLFRQKRDFQRDSESGRLGSPAAKDLLNKLRPRLWLAAHLHVKFEAIVTHTEYNPLAVFVPHAAIDAQKKVLAAESASQAEIDRSAWLEKVKEAADKAKEIEKQNATEPAAAAVPADTNAQTTVVETPVEIEVDPAEQEKDKAEKAEKISAWNNFHSVADEQDAALIKDAQGDSEIEDDKNYQVTWRKIEASEDGMSRVDAGVEKFEISRPKASAATEGADAEAKNPDEIDLDSSDVEDNDRKDGVKLETTEPVTSADAVKPEGVPEGVPTTTATATTTNPDEIDLDADDEEMGEQDNAVEAPIPAQPEVIVQSAADTGVETELTPAAKSNPDEIDVDLEMEDADTTELAASTDTAVSSTPTIRPPVAAAGAVQSAVQPPSAPEQTSTETDSAIAASQVTRVDGAVMATALPAGITNTVTRFLSLDKIEQNKHKRREFLDLMEVPLSDSAAALSISDDTDSGATTPDFKLEYDPEWLAITKALASEIVYGCEPDDPVPGDKGDIGYLPAITSARAWVEENIVAQNKLTIPQNFTHTAAPITDFNDPEQTRIPVGMAVEVQPKEYTNPQTAAYCKMLDIPNIFDITEEEREARRAKGPKPFIHYPRHNNKRNFNGPRGPGAGNDGNARRASGFGGGRGGRGGNRNQGRGGGSSGRDWSWYNNGGQRQRQDGGGQGNDVQSTGPGGDAGAGPGVSGQD